MARQSDIDSQIMAAVRNRGGFAPTLVLERELTAKGFNRRRFYDRRRALIRSGILRQESLSDGVVHLEGVSLPSSGPPRLSEFLCAILGERIVDYFDHYDGDLPSEAQASKIAALLAFTKSIDEEFVA